MTDSQIGLKLLACTQCQQRKVKCDRKTPCSECVRHDAECISGSLVRRPRKRRFPERELLNRVQAYEELLRQNHIGFEPLHSAGALPQRPLEDASLPAHSPQITATTAKTPDSASSTTGSSTTLVERKKPWVSLYSGLRPPDAESDFSDGEAFEAVLAEAWEPQYGTTNNPFLGVQKIKVSLVHEHPPTSQIFKLWQIYLDNVDPLFKITHRPSLQARIVEAVGDLGAIDSALEALLFSIYCMALRSLDEEECMQAFGWNKDGFIAKYESICQLALSNANYMQTDSRDSLTALFLYLVSYGFTAHPKAVSSMNGQAIRIAERIGMHSEELLSKQTPFEAEMRRRLWWAMVLLDSRISGLAANSCTSLNPLWDCRVPLNVNDSDLRPSMIASPQSLQVVTEASFVVVRSHLGDFYRCSNFHLDLCSIKYGQSPDAASDASENGLAKTIRIIERIYSSSNPPGDAMGAMIHWEKQLFHDKWHMLHELCKTKSEDTYRVSKEADVFARRILDVDSHIMTLPATKGLRWLLDYYFPFPAYMQLFQATRNHLVEGEDLETVWNSVGESFVARSILTKGKKLGLFIAHFALQSWTSRNAAPADSSQETSEPWVITEVKAHVALLKAQKDRGKPLGHFQDVDMTDFGIPFHMQGQDFLNFLDEISFNPGQSN